MLHLDSKPEVACQLSVLGTSFFKASWYAGLEDSMKFFLRASQRLVQYFEVSSLNPSIVLPTDNSLFLLLGYQLVSIRYTATPVEDFDSHPVSCLLNEPLRLSLFIYLNMRIWNFQDYPIMHHLVKSLRDSLLCTISTTFSASALLHIKTTAPDVLFWILFIGGMAAQGHSPHLWFVHQLVDLAAILELRDWRAVRKLLGGYLYTDQTGQPRGGEMLWELVLLTELEGY